jgi:hypothetical protein
VLTRDEFLHVEARVGVVEQEVEGEKMVTRHILEQNRRNGEDLAEFKQRTDQRFDRLERRFDNLERRFDNLERRFDGFERQLPTIVGAVIRDVLQERDKKR